MSTQLIVRFISTVYNYDFTIDMIFHPDGSIEVKNQASGYLQAVGLTSPSGNNDVPSFGTKIRAATVGSLHEHLFGWKVDLDILGTANSLQRREVATQAFTHPWSIPSSNNWMKVMQDSVIAAEALGQSTYAQDLSRPTWFEFFNPSAALVRRRKGRGEY